MIIITVYAQNDQKGHFDMNTILYTILTDHVWSGEISKSLHLNYSTGNKDMDGPIPIPRTAQRCATRTSDTTVGSSG